MGRGESGWFACKRHMDALFRRGQHVVQAAINGSTSTSICPHSSGRFRPDFRPFIMQHQAAVSTSTRPRTSVSTQPLTLHRRFSPDTTIRAEGWWMPANRMMVAMTTGRLCRPNHCLIQDVIVHVIVSLPTA
jgi:hypothetical protein